MNSQFLTTSVFDSGVYDTSFGKIITEYTNPVCPATRSGATQVYNVQNGMCADIPASAAVAPGSTAPGCGGDPFKFEVNGQCYNTNNCPSSPSLATTCVNTQHVPVRQNPMSGPGVLYNSVYTGDASDYWRWM